MSGIKSAAMLSLGLMVAGVASAEDWQLAKSEGGIKVYLSTVPGSSYKAYRGQVTIDSDLATLRRLQEDASGSCAWIHACASQKLLKTQGAESWVYTRFDMPWQVQARDSVLHVVTQEEADGSLLRRLEGVPTYQKEEQGYVRVASVEGFWRMTPTKDGKVDVTYQLHTEPGGSVPSWLASRFVVDAPFNTLKALKIRAEKR